MHALMLLLLSWGLPGLAFLLAVALATRADATEWGP